MDKFLNSRIFRVLVCLILVCCILVNASPIKAKAVTPIALTGWAILALTAALGAGVVLNPATPQVANAIGEELNKTAQRVVPDGWDTIAKVCDHLDNMVPEWDPGDYHNDLKTALAGGLLTAITAMTVAAVVDGVVNTEVEEETNADEGYLYCGETLIPSLDSIPEWVKQKYPNYMIYRRESKLCVCFTDGVFYYNNSDTSAGYVGWVLVAGSDAITDYCNFSVYEVSGTTWTSYFSGGTRSGLYQPDNGSLLGGNCNPQYSDGSLYASVSEPSSTKTSTTIVPVVPEIYVGDIPQKIQNGEDDPEKLNIPLIDPSRFITSPDTAFEEITKVGQDIKNGTTTYNEFVTNNQFQQPTPNPDNPDPSTPPDTSDPTEETEPDEEEEKPIGEMGNFTLDLSDYFPFCVPFDIYDFFSCLSASPVAPVIHWEVPVPGGGSYSLDVDLSPYDSVAQLLRRLQLLLFSVGLAFKTRDLIKG